LLVFIIVACAADDKGVDAQLFTVPSLPMKANVSTSHKGKNEGHITQSQLDSSNVASHKDKERPHTPNWIRRLKKCRMILTLEDHSIHDGVAKYVSFFTRTVLQEYLYLCHYLTYVILSTVHS
jgi:hypothetical protein